ncbi:MAG: FAD:protein FMN transferase, partial [Fimbriimonadales bacterium]|nr:FAD:protein FMN transferase [Fimbriimonadales bacterium]
MRLQRFEFKQIRMGVDAVIIVYAPTEAHAFRACRAAYARISVLEQQMSDYRVDSELNQLCQRAVGRWVRVSPELFYVLWRAQHLARQTQGAFDITLGPLVRLWREARRTGALPDEATLRAAKARSGYHLLELSLRRRAVRLKTEGMQLDLGGIAKGYACDHALRALRQHGIRHALIQMGGDIVAGDAPPDTSGWRI